MNDLRPALPRFHHPLESDRMVLRHRRPHNQHRVRITQVLLRSGRPAPPKARSKTWNGGGVSYTGLVGDADHPQANGEEFFDQIIFFDIEGGAAEMGYGFRLHYEFASFFVFFLKGALARFP